MECCWQLEHSATIGGQLQWAYYPWQYSANRIVGLWDGDHALGLSHYQPDYWEHTHGLPSAKQTLQ